MEKKETAENCKKPQFGTRYLTDQDQVFQHNAWDDVEWNEDLKKNAEDKLKLNSQTLVPIESQDDLKIVVTLNSEELAQQLQTHLTKISNWAAKREKYEAEANLFWDKFYNIHENRFFKDRHWLFTEFPELSLKSDSDKATSSENEVSTNQDRVQILEVGCGVGNTVFPILETNVGTNVFVYCCDFSEVAVSLVKANPLYDPNRCHSFVCDVSADNWDAPFEENSLDFIILVFVLSAINPDKMQTSVNKLAKYLKPGGQILFRDYGKYDMVELRFKPGRCLSEHFYVRGDGTRVFFFSEGEVDKLFTSAGLVKTQLYSSKRLQVNRGKLIKMYRIWIQAKYVKPLCS